MRTRIGAKKFGGNGIFFVCVTSGELCDLERGRGHIAGDLGNAGSGRAKVADDRLHEVGVEIGEKI